MQLSGQTRCHHHQHHHQNNYNHTNTAYFLRQVRCSAVEPHCVHLQAVVLFKRQPASGAEDPGFESRLRRDFSGSGHTSDSKIGTPVATLPGAWHHRVSAGTGWPGGSIL